MAHATNIFQSQGLAFIGHLCKPTHLQAALVFTFTIELTIALKVLFISAHMVIDLNLKSNQQTFAFQ